MQEVSGSGCDGRQAWGRDCEDKMFTGSGCGGSVEGNCAWSVEGGNGCEDIGVGGSGCGGVIVDGSDFACNKEGGSDDTDALECEGIEL